MGAIKEIINNQCCSGKLKTSSGYVWRYADNNKIIIKMKEEIEEEFRDIPGYEGLYQVSNIGRVKSLRYKGGNNQRLLKPKTSKTGYLSVVLFKDKRKDFLVHRLVALTFIENPENKPQINHKNGIKNDNRIENLERCTGSENQRHSYDILKRKSSMYGKKLSEETKLKMRKPKSEEYKLKKCKQITQYSISGKFIKEYNSLKEACETLKTSLGNISQCCYGKQKTAGGYIWKYVDKTEKEN